MEQELFNWVLDLPLFVAKFADWLTTPLNTTYLNISPLTLLSVNGMIAFIGLITIHLVRLFV